VAISRDIIPLPKPILGGALADNDNLYVLAAYLLYINIFWALMNLLPVIPLDGGQIALQVLMQQDPWQGTLRALWLSVIVGAVVAAFALLKLQQQYLMFLFASLAVSNFFAIQQLGGGGRRPW
jgi:stage IV sporulation protein FB